MNAQAIHAAQYRHCARSPEWKAGALRGLQLALGETVSPKVAPYASGSAQDDAWLAGVKEGLAEGKWRVTHAMADAADGPESAA